MNQNDAREHLENCLKAEHTTVKRQKTAKEIIALAEERIKNPPIGSWAWKERYGLNVQ
jgi:hypothetical protein